MTLLVSPENYQSWVCTLMTMLVTGHFSEVLPLEASSSFVSLFETESQYVDCPETPCVAQTGLKFKAPPGAGIKVHSTMPDNISIFSDGGLK